jgi:hypothetical protein
LINEKIIGVPGEVIAEISVHGQRRAIPTHELAIEH